VPLRIIVKRKTGFINVHLNLINSMKNLQVDRRISPDDRMYASGSERHYFYVGMSNILAILNAVNIGLAYPGGDRAVQRILDFGCGYGRVTRYLRAAFPTADIWVADLDPGAVRWCAENYRCAPIENDPASKTFDLVWLGSVFTHLPEGKAERLLLELSQCLRPTGIFIFTSQGRFAIQRLEGIMAGAIEDRPYARYGIEIALVKKIISGYRSTGYGYVDYPHQTDYGVCCAEPTWYSNRMFSHPDFTQLLLQEKGTDNHQDVNAFIRSPLMDETKGGLW